MAAWIIGTLLIVIGAMGAFNALRFIHFTATVFPREMTRGDVANIVAESFIFRFMSLLLIAAGIAVILLEVLDGR